MQITSQTIVDAAYHATSVACLLDTQPTGSTQNQLVFFFKPEVFLSPPSTAAAIIDLAFRQFTAFDIAISSCHVITGGVLNTSSVMDRHYGYINTLSRSASTVLSPLERRSIQEALKISNDTRLLGGHEALQEYPTLTWRDLDELWSSKDSIKIRSGMYVQCYEIDGTPVVLVNGFHPAQLAHFTEPDRRLALLVLHSNLPWIVLRRRFLGDTFPERATRGSFRRTLYEQRSELELDVSIANNFAHLSAGPFEALAEVQNFFSYVSPTLAELASTTVGQTMISRGFSPSEIMHATTNPSIDTDSISLSLFDATEEADTYSSIALYGAMFRDSIHT